VLQAARFPLESKNQEVRGLAGAGRGRTETGHTRGTGEFGLLEGFGRIAGNGIEAPNGKCPYARTSLRKSGDAADVLAR
jgi:hypothetical protein